MIVFNRRESRCTVVQFDSTCLCIEGSKMKVVSVIFDENLICCWIISGIVILLTRLNDCL